MRVPLPPVPPVEESLPLPDTATAASFALLGTVAAVAASSSSNDASDVVDNNEVDGVGDLDGGFSLDGDAWAKTSPEPGYDAVAVAAAVPASPSDTGSAVGHASIPGSPTVS